MTVELDQNGCTGNPLAWDVHLKFGNTDITASAEGAGWASPTTLPGKLFKLTLSVKAVSLPSASGCANFLDDSVFTHGLDAQFEQVFALTNVV
jgi:hypothetical protein